MATVVLITYKCYATILVLNIEIIHDNSSNGNSGSVIRPYNHISHTNLKIFLLCS